MSRDKKVSVQVVYGGADINRQIRALKNKPQIIVGTPGRLLDHIKRKTIRLDHIETLVLDEADEMLNMSFLEDIEAILSETPAERQTLLFSATMPDSIKKSVSNSCTLQSMSKSKKRHTLQLINRSVFR